MKPSVPRIGQPAVAPRRQAVGREPVDPNVAGPPVAAQRHVPEILERGVLLVVEITDLRGDDLGAGRAGEEEELVRLVRRDVAENAAEPRAFEEPRGTGLRIHAVWPETDGLHDPADRPGLDELRGANGRAVFEALAVHDGINAPRLRLHATDLGELVERRDARLVDHVVLPVLHHADAERRPLVRDRGAQHQLDARHPPESPVHSGRASPGGTVSGRRRARSASFAKTETSSPPPRSTASVWP